MIEYSNYSMGGCSELERRRARVRTIRLIRPSAGTAVLPLIQNIQGQGFGFSIRGGREHGTGFFVSAIETGSEAHRQGLMIGDQILRVNGFTVDDAIHKEILQLISNHTHLTLKVRNVGMIPVKEKCTDPLGWQIIQDTPSIGSGSPPLGEKQREVRISMCVAPRSKLGCGICKGPEWKPGIFVQFTKEGGIAREAGLRPGDQLLYCNGVDFSDIPFNEAVNVLKTSYQLDLLVRKQAGLELFPGESSGYNSSASSVTGDQSPSWSDSKRLSIVKEETLDLEDRLIHLDTSRYQSKQWENWDSQSLDSDSNRNNFKPTIINLTENGTTIQNNGDSEDLLCQNNLLNETVVSNHKHNLIDKTNPSNYQQLMNHDTKTVVVEVHRSETDHSSDEISNKSENVINNSSSTNSFTSLASSSASSSLSSAITQELLRRSERKKENGTKNIDDELQKKKTVMKATDLDKKQQHDKLMDEFKKVHRKMFASPDENTNEKEGSNSSHELNTSQCSEFIERSTFVSTLSHGEIKYPDEDREQNKSFPRRSADSSFAVTKNNTGENGVSKRQTDTANNGMAPPPPPLPFTETNGNSAVPTSKSTSPLKQKAPAPPVPQKTYNKYPPPCPTPDYDTISICSNSSANNIIKPNNQTTTSTFMTSRMTPYNTNNINSSHSIPVSDAVEMESLESFKLNNPSGPKPKPPNTYFNRPKLSPQSSNGSVSSADSNASKKMRRPISVTIGEYPTGVQRRTPTKFEFLSQSGDYDEHDLQSTNTGFTDEPITSRLASELSQTLSRSNLRSRTESMDISNRYNNSTAIKSQSNGSVTISVTNMSNNGSGVPGTGQHRTLTKAQSMSSAMASSVENLSNLLSNRLTIRIQENEAASPENKTPPNGILKNGNSNGNGNPCLNNHHHRPVVQQKSITFGEITTVINDRTHNAT